MHTGVDKILLDGRSRSSLTDANDAPSQCAVIGCGFCSQMEPQENNNNGHNDGSPLGQDIKQEEAANAEDSQENQNPPGVSVIRSRQVITTAGIIVEEPKIEVGSEEIVKSSASIHGSPGKSDKISSFFF